MQLNVLLLEIDNSTTDNRSNCRKDAIKFNIFKSVLLYVLNKTFV